MSTGRPPLLALLGSLAIHGGGGLLLVSVLARPALLPPLLVELTAVVEDARGPAPAGPAVAVASASRAAGSSPGPPSAAWRSAETPTESPGRARAEFHRVSAPPAAPPPEAHRPGPEEPPAVAGPPSPPLPPELPTTVAVMARGPEPTVAPKGDERGREAGGGTTVGAQGGGLAGGSSTGRGPGGSGSDAGTGAGLHAGGGLALAIPGPGTQGGVGFEGDHVAYLAGLRQRIQEVLRYPLPARRRGVTGTVHVELLIEPTGKVAVVSVTESSSHRLLDEAAVEAIRSVAPVPFPAGLPRRALRVRLPVVFDLR